MFGFKNKGISIKKAQKILNKKTKGTSCTTDNTADDIYNDIINHIEQGGDLIANRAVKLYKEYFLSFITNECFSETKHSKPIIAALLFSALDLNFQNHHAREKAAKGVFSYLETFFTQSELQLFDSSFDVFVDLIRNKYSARGDWCYLDKPVTGWYMNCFIACGDMIRYPQYIYNYTNEPIQIDAPEANLLFTIKFTVLETPFLNYIKNLRNLLDIRV